MMITLIFGIFGILAVFGTIYWFVKTLEKA